MTSWKRWLLPLAITLMIGSLSFAQKETKPKEDPDLKADLEKLQGTWQRVEIDDQGNVGSQQVKVIKGNMETLTNYGDNQKIKSQHTVEFKLEKSGDVKIFTFGPPGGLDDKERTYSYVYRLDDDIFYDCPGLIPTRRSYSDTPAIYEWRRVRERRDVKDDKNP